MTASLFSSSAPLSYAYLAGSAGGRISLPVPPSQVIYSNFRHVAGQAAAEGGGSLSLDRLKILDILIERLRSVKEEPLAAREAPSDLKGERVDALIAQYGAELHSRSVAASLPYATRPAVEPGMLFSFAA